MERGVQQVIGPVVNSVILSDAIGDSRIFGHRRKFLTFAEVMTSLIRMP